MAKAKKHHKPSSHIQHKVRADAVCEAYTLFLYALVYVMHDKNGYGKKRAKRLLGQIESVIESIGKNYLAIEDIKKILNDEMQGFEIGFKG